jgi:AMP-polyphosphate phosphotransferase
VCTALAVCIESDSNKSMPLEALRQDLLDAQATLLAEKKRPVIVVLAGFSGAGKGDVAARFSEWLDPRFVRSLTIERNDRFPAMHETWRTLPANGQTNVVFWGWYEQVFFQTAAKAIRKRDFQRELERADELERMLIADGAVIVKIWLDLTKKQQNTRLSELERDKRTSWRATRSDWKEHKNYSAYAAARDKLLAVSSTEASPWHIISGANPAERDLQAGSALLQALRESKNARKAPRANPTATEKPQSLGKLDRAQSFSKQKAENLIPLLQGKLSKLLREPKFQKRGLVLAFEGSDAAGKGGAIRRLTCALDARVYRVIPIAAPSPEERAHNYLWRFWRDVPPLGKVTLFDRSWYGRVLVERVEKFATEADWKRAYREIAAFEEELTEHGLIVAKFWLSITKEEQLLRFKARAEDPLKRFKITEDDYRNRKQWHAYEEAADDAFRFTDRPKAPWTLVGANDKDHARVTILKTLVERIESEL